MIKWVVGILAALVLSVVGWAGYNAYYDGEDYKNDPSVVYEDGTEYGSYNR